MAFDISRFYQDLDACYGNHDNAATEAFLKKSRDVADRAGAPMPVNTGCPSCVTPLEPNWAYVSVCNEMACFYRGLSRFSESLEVFELAQKELESVKIEDEVTDEVCDLCGRNMVVKYGPHGKFLACPGFPDCRNTKPYYEKIGVACPKCGGEIVMKKTKKGRKYYGCENNPECDFMSWQKPSAKKCPKCGNYMLEKGNKLVCSQETCGYVEQKPKDED